MLDKGFTKVVGFFDIDPDPDPSKRVCKMPGCDKLCYVENDGRIHDFCGKGHANEYRAMKEEERRQKGEAQPHGFGVG